MSDSTFVQLNNVFNQNLFNAIKFVFQMNRKSCLITTTKVSLQNKERAGKKHQIAYRNAYFIRINFLLKEITFTLSS